MSPTKRTLAALGLPLALMTTAAQAAPITSLEGVMSPPTLIVSPSGDIGAVGNLVLFGGMSGTTTFNNASVGPFNTVFESLVLRIADTSVSGDITTYSFDSSFDPIAGVLMLLTDGVGSFSFTLTEASVNTLDVDTAIFRGAILTAAGTPTFDLSPLTAGGLFTIAVTSVLPGADFNTLFAAGGSAQIASATFTQSAATAVAPVPEPGSMILLATGLAGAGVRRWRQRRARI